MHQTNFKIIPLKNHAVIEITGPDAQKFLQGQLTCDVQQLPLGRATLGAHCTPKGRIISNFTLYKLNETTIYLKTHTTNLNNAMKNLEKYSVFFKVTLTIKENLNCYAVLDKKAQLIDKQVNVLIDIEHMPNETWITKEQADKIFTNYEVQPESLYELFAIKAGIVDITDKLTEKLLPHDIGMQFTSAISFKKGCYTGQEIIARMEYKATIKKHIMRLECTEALNLNIGDSFINADSKTGIVLRSAKFKEKEEYLILCNNESLSDSAKNSWHQTLYAIT